MEIARVTGWLVVDKDNRCVGADMLGLYRPAFPLHEFLPNENTRKATEACIKAINEKYPNEGLRIVEATLPVTTP